MKHCEDYQNKIKNIEIPNILENTIEFLKKLSEALEEIVNSKNLTEEEKNQLNMTIGNKRDNLAKQISVLYKTLIENNPEKQVSDLHSTLIENNHN
jgi:hypothetical protein